MKDYNFDEIIARRGTGCVKHDGLKALYGRDDLLPMWVADMDFRSPDFVMDALRERCQHEVLGYPVATQSYWDTLIEWFKMHYNIETSEKELHFIPGIVAGISFALLALTKPGDKVLVTTPVYPPFLTLPANCGRELVVSPLMVRNGHFAINFDDFEQRAEGCTAFILSNPHNPAGTVWGEVVLKRIADICHRKGLLVIADEIHADLTLPPHKHISYSTVSDESRENSLTFMAPSKTFNIAGLSSSVCYIGDEALRKRFFGWLDGCGVAGGNIFAYVGAEAAFRNGEEWRRQMLNYLVGNVETLRKELASLLPKTEILLPEASYLAWLDFSNYGLSHKELSNILINKAHVALNDGTTFGGNAYECCFRMNIGCPRSTLIDALHRIAQSF